MEKSEKIREEFGKFLRTKRESVELSHRKIAEMIGIKFQNYQKYEYGKKKPRDTIRARIAKVYGKSLKEFDKEFLNYCNENTTQKKGVLKCKLLFYFLF